MSTLPHALPGSDARLTQTDLARRWKLSTRSLEKWRTLGTGPVYVKVGGAVRYRLEDILAYEDAHLRRGER